MCLVRIVNLARFSGLTFKSVQEEVKSVSKNHHHVSKQVQTKPMYLCHVSSNASHLLNVGYETQKETSQPTTR